MYINKLFVIVEDYKIFDVQSKNLSTTLHSELLNYFYRLKNAKGKFFLISTYIGTLFLHRKPMNHLGTFCMHKLTTYL